MAGGGVLKCEHMGIAELKCEDGSSMLLSNILYVPNLGVNLFSVRRLCQAGLTFSGNESKLHLKDGKHKVITAQMVNGLYIVTNVAASLEDKAFPSVDTEDVDETAQPSVVDSHEEAQSSDDEATKKSDKERYILFHRRFAHLGPEKLRNLHKVTNLKDKIKIPKDRGVCDVCSLAKLHNKIPKTLRDWNTELLGRVQFDIAGPFPRS